MHDQETQIPAMFGHLPWNKGKLTGAKPPLQARKLGVADGRGDVPMAKAHDGPVPLALPGMPADVHPERKGGKQEQPSEMF
jgi:hypothetical protein